MKESVLCTSSSGWSCDCGIAGVLAWKQLVALLLDDIWRWGSEYVALGALKVAFVCLSWSDCFLLLHTVE